MAFNILDLANTIKNLIEKNNTNTSTYYVSSSMTSIIQKVGVGYYKDKPIPEYLFPCVYIEPRGLKEDYEHIGNIAKRNIIATFSVVGLTYEGLGQLEGREISDRDMLQMSANLQTLFRNYPKLSATSYVLSNEIESVDYDVSVSNNTYNSIAIINLQIKIYSI